jgi:hypothetical protein
MPAATSGAVVAAGGHPYRTWPRPISTTFWMEFAVCERCAGGASGVRKVPSDLE